MPLQPCITRHPVLQVARLADVKNPVLFIQHPIHARRPVQRAQETFYDLGSGQLSRLFRGPGHTFAIPFGAASDAPGDQGVQASPVLWINLRGNLSALCDATENSQTCYIIAKLIFIVRH